MKPAPTCLLLALALAGLPVRAAEWHVAPHGSDAGPGTRRAPLRTIQRAADLAHPGDTITVHAGVYRERVNPPRGGASDRQRIVYRAAPGERVEIKGSEIVRGWEPVQGEVWKVTLPNAFFGDFNPFADRLHGDWFDPRGREHHTGAVYLNGEWLIEAAALEEVLPPPGAAAGRPAAGPAGPRWFARVEAGHTTIWAQFPGADPNRELVEVNVRRTVFYPDQPGRNYLTVRGFILRHAATPWAPPTAEQIGLIGTHWSKGWIIESNVISHSICAGIALGKHSDAFDNTSANTAEGYVKTIERAHAFRLPWTREHIGHHVVRGNTISHCEQAGIVGSLGGAFCRIEGNVIHDIHVRRLFSGAEMAGIKLHAAIDTVIRGNHLYRACRGLWLDWMAQGTRVSRNLFHDNGPWEDLFVEVNHGPFVVDHNLFLSPTSLLDMSEGGAYAHNLFAGKLISVPEPGRETPFHPAHSTAVAGLRRIEGGDNRFFNNVFLGRGGPGSAPAPAVAPLWTGGYGLWGYDFRPHPTRAAGNIYLAGAQPGVAERDTALNLDADPALRLTEEHGRWYLHLYRDRAWDRAATRRITSDLLGRARVPDLPYVHPDDSPLVLDRDWFGHRRGPRPTPGPFEKPGRGPLRLCVW
jgi:alpha-N-arabinofuranosidase